jgi:type II secretory pathway pseudopilin PulG
MLEILVVAGLMLFLFGVAANSLTGLNRARRLRNSTERVAAVISLARSRAISENAIYHVRVENRGPADQWISVYRFPRTSDALKATTEPVAWNPHAVQGDYSNYLVERQKLEPGCYFETQYQGNTLWDSVRNRVRTKEGVHGSQPDGELYYDLSKPLTLLPKDAGADGVESAHPEPLGLPPDQRPDPLLQLIRRLVSEGDGQDVLGRDATFADHIRQSVGEGARLAGAWTGNDLKRPADDCCCGALVRVEG